VIFVLIQRRGMGESIVMKAGFSVLMDWFGVTDVSNDRQELMIDGEKYPG